MQPQLASATSAGQLPASRCATRLRSAYLLRLQRPRVRSKPAATLGAAPPFDGQLGHGRAPSRCARLRPQLLAVPNLLVAAPTPRRAFAHRRSPPALGSQTQSARRTSVATGRRTALATRALRRRQRHSPRVPHRGAEPPRPPPHDGTPVRSMSPPPTDPDVDHETAVTGWHPPPDSGSRNRRRVDHALGAAKGVQAWPDRPRSGSAWIPPCHARSTPGRGWRARVNSSMGGGAGSPTTSFRRWPPSRPPLPGGAKS